MCTTLNFKNVLVNVEMSMNAIEVLLIVSSCYIMLTNSNSNSDAYHIL